jgi:hypothetical protein
MWHQGVPLRVEVGPRDVAEGTCVVARRDRPGKDGKQFGIPLEPAAFVHNMRGLLDGVHVSGPHHSDTATSWLPSEGCKWSPQ